MYSTNAFSARLKHFRYIGVLDMNAVNVMKAQKKYTNIYRKIGSDTAAAS